MSILDPLRVRGQRLFNQVETVTQAITEATDYLGKASKEMNVFVEYQKDSADEHQEITVGIEHAGEVLDRVSGLLLHLATDMRDYEQTQMLLNTKFSETLSGFQVLLGKWQETEDISEGMLQEIMSLTTLLNNLIIFFSDTDELAAVLSQVDRQVLKAALEKLDLSA